MVKIGILHKLVYGIAALCLATTAALVVHIGVQAQDGSARYFEETGLNVSGPFLHFFDAYGGASLFGYPLTRAYEEDGQFVQVFQRAKMELHEGGPGGSYVTLAPLGDMLWEREAPIPPSEIPAPGHAGKQYFAETGHMVCFSFLDFYRSHGGVDVFGYPITEWFVEPNGRIVQYFQHVKMEWHPENPPHKRVQLGMLGMIYVQQYVDPIHTQPESPAIAARTPLQETVSQGEVPVDPGRVTELRVRASVRESITGADSKQTVYVYVFDQNGRGVPGASVGMQVGYQGRTATQSLLPATNANGHSEVEFEVESPTVGPVVILRLSARYGDLVTQTSTAFLAWW
ncbi:MAG: hypothetical protein ACK2VD_06970 [Anaerolineae bacterium]|jgi:hypothetical protein